MLCGPKESTVSRPVRPADVLLVQAEPDRVVCDVPAVPEPGTLVVGPDPRIRRMAIEPEEPTSSAPALRLAPGQRGRAQAAAGRRPACRPAVQVHPSWWRVAPEQLVGR